MATKMVEMGTRVRVLRAVHGMTQAELGARSGLATFTIHRIEAGKSKPHRATLAVLADALGCEQLFISDGPDEPEEMMREALRVVA